MSVDAELLRPSARCALGEGGQQRHCAHPQRLHDAIERSKPRSHPPDQPALLRAGERVPAQSVVERYRSGRPVAYRIGTLPSASTRRSLDSRAIWSDAQADGAGR